MSCYLHVTVDEDDRVGNLFSFAGRAGTSEAAASHLFAFIRGVMRQSASCVFSYATAADLGETSKLVETFNWLLGLNVKHIDVIRGVRVVEGKAPNGDRVLVLWRNIDKM